MKNKVFFIVFLIAVLIPITALASPTRSEIISQFDNYIHAVERDGTENIFLWNGDTRKPYINPHYPHIIQVGTGLCWNESDCALYYLIDNVWTAQDYQLSYRVYFDGTTSSILESTVDIYTTKNYSTVFF